MIKYFMISLIGIIVFMNGYCIKKGALIPMDSIVIFT